MTLREKQNLFCKLVPRLIDKIYETGFSCTFGDAWSKPFYNEHKPHSNHYIRLAIDINLFSPEGAYLDTTEAHKVYGEYWESLHPLCRWGGRFNDGGHYSLEHNGCK